MNKDLKAIRDKIEDQEAQDRVMREQGIFVVRMPQAVMALAATHLAEAIEDNTNPVLRNMHPPKEASQEQIEEYRNDRLRRKREAFNKRQPKKG